MRKNLRPSKRAIGKSWQKGNDVRKFALPPEENLDGRVFRCNDGPGSEVVADTPATGEPSLGRRGLNSGESFCRHIGPLLASNVWHSSMGLYRHSLSQSPLESSPHRAQECWCTDLFLFRLNCPSLGSHPDSFGK